MPSVPQQEVTELLMSWSQGDDAILPEGYTLYSQHNSLRE
jgi:hypothetical protein